MSRSPSAIAVVSMLVLAACEPKQSSTANAAPALGEAAAAGDPNLAGARCYEAQADWAVADAPYPDWARDVFPPYPEARPTPCIAGLYEFWTGDDPKTVLAWYKAHTHVTWRRAGTVPDGWDGWRNSVAIFIAPPPTPANRVKTVIQIKAEER